MASPKDSAFGNELDAENESSGEGVSRHPDQSSESGSGFGTDSSTSSRGKAERRIINRSKLIVYASLFLTSILVTVSTFILVRRQETEAFESDFIDLANEIIDISEKNAANTIGQVENLAIAIASFAASSHGTWPNITLPHFEQRTQAAMDLTRAELIAFAPIVPVDQKQAFIEYADEVWIRQGVKDVDSIPHQFHDLDGYGSDDKGLGFHTLLWQTVPEPRDTDIYLLELNTFEWFPQLQKDVLEVKHAIMSGIVDLEYLLQATREEKHFEWHPRSVVLKGIPRDIETAEAQRDSERDGFVMAVIPWEEYFTDVIPHDIHGFLVEVDDHCGKIFSYEIDGHKATVRGEGNLHESRYDHLHQSSDFAKFAQYDGEDTSVIHCYYTVDVYPTDDLKALYTSAAPYMYSVAIFLVMMFTIFVFFCYDWLVQRRQNRISRVAKQTTSIVKSLFPKNVQDRIMKEVELATQQEMDSARRSSSSYRVGMKDRLKNALKEEDEMVDQDAKTRFNSMPPIADLFPSVTVMFADLVGFTAWSSMREPAQVFQLLETIYCEFDGLAKRRRIFKVETVGDCYVAASGIPDARRDHAVAMARFARECRSRLMSLVKNLELSLGPDTLDLGVRIGLHSGPVTGGVLRGDKARFQLFGDTMNTTARIESTGKKNMIHLSEETAQAIRELGKGHWVQPREDSVVAKGKGELATFWLVRADGPGSADRMSGTDASSSNNGKDYDEFVVAEDIADLLPEKVQRLVRWNTDMLAKHLKEIVLQRQALSTVRNLEKVQKEEEQFCTAHGVLGEVVDIISIPTFDSEAAERKLQLPEVTLSDAVMEQLHSYVMAIASLYRDNAFHNFEHVSHVTMSVSKLLSRIVAPDVSAQNLNDDRLLHDHTYGITSDPTIQFAALFAALTHDVDHQGVTNATLVAEDQNIAMFYNGKSVAEQNSVDIAWSLLVGDSQFEDLRYAIYSTPEEFHRFRQLVVNMVMATDIMDKELSQARKQRWATAFGEGGGVEESGLSSFNRKATIVLEHLIQASDVAHTMQHWHVFRKWNTRLFQEMMRAYKAGRTNTNPADNWYEGEIGFFDFYVIPLAKKLKNCGVFGVSSDEYLNYAVKNRREWHAKGKEIVAEMVESMDQEANIAGE